MYHTITSTMHFSHPITYLPKYAVEQYTSDPKVLAKAGSKLTLGEWGYEYNLGPLENA